MRGVRAGPFFSYFCPISYKPSSPIYFLFSPISGNHGFSRLSTPEIDINRQDHSGSKPKTSESLEPIDHPNTLIPAPRSQRRRSVERTPAVCRKAQTSAFMKFGVNSAVSSGVDGDAGSGNSLSSVRQHGDPSLERLPSPGLNVDYPREIFISTL